MFHCHKFVVSGKHQNWCFIFKFCARTSMHVVRNSKIYFWFFCGVESMKIILKLVCCEYGTPRLQCTPFLPIGSYEKPSRHLQNFFSHSFWWGNIKVASPPTFYFHSFSRLRSFVCCNSCFQEGEIVLNCSTRKIIFLFSKLDLL